MGQYVKQYAGNSSVQPEGLAMTRNREEDSQVLRATKTSINPLPLQTTLLKHVLKHHHRVATGATLRHSGLIFPPHVGLERCLPLLRRCSRCSRGAGTVGGVMLAPGGGVAGRRLGLRRLAVFFALEEEEEEEEEEDEDEKEALDPRSSTLDSRPETLDPGL